MDNIDNVIENVMQKNIYEPIEFEQSILTAFKKKKQYNLCSNIIIKIISAITAFLTITAGVVFAKDISNWIYNIFNPVTTSRGIIKMAENGYYQNVEMEYVQSNGNSVKIENIIMDDYNLNIVFELKTKEKLESVFHIEMPDLIITDENKNIVFCDYSNKEGYERYCKQNNIEYSEKNMHNNCTNGGYGIEIIETTENNIKFLYKMYSNKYPKSKKIKFEFENINILSGIQDIDKPSNKISGRWNIEIDLPEKFYNRELKTYTVKDNSDKENNIILKSAIAANTEMQIEITIKQVLEEIDSTQQDVENRMNNIFDNIIAGNEIIDNAILENENGEKFGITTSSREGNFSRLYRKNGDIDVHMCFDITKNEYTDNLKLSLQVKGKTVIINLSK